MNKFVWHNKAFRLSFCLLLLLDKTGRRAHQELYNLEKSDKEKFHTGMKKSVYRMGCRTETISYKTVIGNKKWLSCSDFLFIAFHIPPSSASEFYYCVRVGGFYFLYLLTFFLFLSPRHSFQGFQSYSLLQLTNLLACRSLLLAFIAFARGQMKKRRSHGNLLCLLVFQQCPWSIINLSFHLHVQQQEEEWDWPFCTLPPLLLSFF